MSLAALVLVIVAIVLAVVANIQSAWKSLLAWAIIALGCGLLIQFLTTWHHVINPG